MSAAGAAVDLLNMRFDNNWDLKVQQHYTGAGNIQYNLIHRYNSVDYNSLTFRGANVGIGVTNPVYKCHIKVTNNDTASGLHLDADDGGGTNPNKHAFTLYPYVVGSSQVGWRFRTQSVRGGTRTPLGFRQDGTVNIGGTLICGPLVSNSYVLGTELYSRISHDASLVADSAGMYLRMGDINSGGDPTYLRFGAYQGFTFMESNASRSIYFRSRSGTFGGAKREQKERYLEVTIQHTIPLTKMSGTFLVIKELKKILKKQI